MSPKIAQIRKRKAIFPKPDERPHHGSHRGAAVMVAATFGWIGGVTCFWFTAQPLWLVLVPFVGILTGIVAGRHLFPDRTY